jgi:hypothetical protein
VSTDARHGTKKLILHIEITDIYVDDLPSYVAEGMGDDWVPTPRRVAAILTSEWIREQVGLTLLPRPGEQAGADEFEIEAHTGTIVGMEIVDKAAGQ